MGTGYLKFQIHTADDALPIANANITIFSSDGNVFYRTTTDENGLTEEIRLFAPDKEHSLNPYNEAPVYSFYNAVIKDEGFLTLHIDNIPVLDTQTTIMPEYMHPVSDEPYAATDEYINIGPNHLVIPSPNLQDVEPLSVGGGATLAAPPEQRAIGVGVVIPDYITVHLGTPNNSAARNVRVRFLDYVKNVVSSEIYSTWPLSSLEANIHAIVTFALNRVYTEWYRSRGFNFDITNSTSYDMAYRDEGPVFQNISELVDILFNVYARRIGFENPFFTQFCNGTTSTCPGLSQWGTVALANQGRSPLEILHYYYPNDLELVMSNNIRGIEESYPGYSLRLGSQGEAVRRMQVFLNRIRVNYPLIPQISNPNGVFGQDTSEAVRAFQRTFNMTADGIIGRDTWNRINFIFVAVTRLAELDSEGIRVTIGETPPSVVLSTGSRGQDVMQLQFLLNYISTYYSTVPAVIQDGVFGASTKNAVIEFQKTFGLSQDGVVGPTTWNKLYAVYKGIQENVPKPPVETPTPGTPPKYPGTPLRMGSTGANVRTMQAYLNVIRTMYPSIPELVVDGIFGSNTLAAVRTFQQLTGLTTDGIIGPLTWDRIVETYLLITGGESVSLEYPGTPLRIGSRGPQVRLIQGFLSELRAPYPSLPAITVDGIFGPNTQAAVMGFQRLFGLTVDGIVGPATWYAIIEERNRAV